MSFYLTHEAHALVDLIRVLRTLPTGEKAWITQPLPIAGATTFVATDGLGSILSQPGTVQVSVMFDPNRQPIIDCANPEPPQWVRLLSMFLSQPQPQPSPEGDTTP